MQLGEAFTHSFTLVSGSSPFILASYLYGLVSGVSGSFRCEQFGLGGILRVRLASVFQHGCFEDEKPNSGDDNRMEWTSKVKVLILNSGREISMVSRGRNGLLLAVPRGVYFD